MSTYELAIKVSFLIFPIIAFIITIPYMIRQYHKYGSIPMLRTIIVYSFVLYLLVAYLMVILPLPSIKEVSLMTTPWTQLIPFRFINDIIMYSGFDINDFSTYLSALKEPLIYVNIFNFLLTIPFGIYLRYYFNRKWWEVLILSFILSFFFEITQLSGLYGIYPRPYRLFDVDDLIVNTLGGLFGHIITPLFSFILPTRKRLDEISYENGKKVSFARRTVAFFIDCIVINVIAIIFVLLFEIEVISIFYSFIYLIYFVLFSFVFKGRTIGKSIVKLKIIDKNNKNVKLYQLLIKYGMMYIIFYKIYDILKWSINISNINEITSLISVIISILLIFIYLKTVLDILLKKERLFYELLSNTKNISTIKYEKNKQNKNESISENGILET
ncbi:MAG: VanZ family protein [Bacilli bacterium]|nr:VanZ family protein [Bacilli bacterium]